MTGIDIIDQFHSREIIATLFIPECHKEQDHMSIQEQVYWSSSFELCCICGKDKDNLVINYRILSMYF